MSDSVRPHRWQPTRLPRPWDSPGKNTGVGCRFLLQCMKVKSESEVAQLWPTLSDPTDCSLPGSSTQGIFQARVLEWGANLWNPLLGLYLEKIIIQNGMCTPVSRAAFFFFYSSWGMQSTKMSRKWWLNGPSIHSAITQNEAMPLPAACMDREIIVRCEVRKRKTNILRYHLQVECKNSYKWTNLQSRNRLTKLEKQLMLIQRNVRG